MSRGGIGSASIILVFSVLCLVIFTVISLVPALNEDALIANEVRMVKAFYAADALAEQILAEILASDEIPQEILGVEIYAFWDWDTLAAIINFMCEVSETKGLYVSVLRDWDSYQILSWRLVNRAEWEADDRINVWQGENDFFMGW